MTGQNRMSVKITEEKDRFHVFTRKYEWTILKTRVNDRSPVVISDVRRLHKPYPIIISEKTDKNTINDPRYGGAFAFGFICCEPDMPTYAPDQFWNHAWEITTRSEISDSFGIVPQIKQVAQSSIMCHVEWFVKSRAVLKTQHVYIFGFNDTVTMQVTAVPFPSNLYMKEPKLCLNGLPPFTSVSVYSREDVLLKTFDLTRYTNPVRSTRQINMLDRFRYDFEGVEGIKRITTHNNEALLVWKAEGENHDPLSDKSINYAGNIVGAPKYCALPGGQLKWQTEIPRWPECLGLAWHGWEGGYGAPDCWNTFRPWPTRTVQISSGLKIEEE